MQIQICYFCEQPFDTERRDELIELIKSGRDDIELLVDTLEFCPACEERIGGRFVFHATTVEPYVEGLPEVGKNNEGQSIYLHPFYYAIDRENLDDVIRILSMSATSDQKDAFSKLKDAPGLLMPLEVIENAAKIANISNEQNLNLMDMSDDDILELAKGGA